MNLNSLKLILLIIVLVMISANAVYADDVQRVSEIKEKQQKNQEEMDVAGEELKQIREEIKEIDQDIELMDRETTELNQNIRDKNSEIEKLNNEIDSLNDEIEVLEERVVEREELLKRRARVLYQTEGSNNFLAVILGSESFSDFISRVQVVTKIAEQDRKLVELYTNDVDALTINKRQVEFKKTTNENMVYELTEMKKNLELQRLEKEDLLLTVEEKEKNLISKLEDLDQQKILLQDEEIKAIQAEYRSVQSTSAPVSELQTIVDSTEFMRPTTGRLTSGYGPRSGSYHYGVDIGKNGRTGDVPIQAANEGEVTLAQYSTSYGNYVILTHQVDGRQIQTLYAHMDRLDVSKGDYVSKGQQIGLMGNTGRSFGAHLHYEVHLGGWNNAKSNSVDPQKFIP
ncbi:murein hydrolase activator EnvC family protein [Alkalihalobacillus sp. 1P02AB]|uniref:murein hydrolase activator EnvC family protein n=1 Tax=Alkalihalobacillus sp. 1P02AB TaxID=3132260 RepID=UPI0039A515FB